MVRLRARHLCWCLLAVLGCRDEVPGGGPIDSARGLSTRGGGCYLPPLAASTLELLALVNPEWAPVVNGAAIASRPVLVHGTAVDSHVSQTDFPATHREYDQNTGLRVDVADAALLATGNALEGPAPLLELEWELGAFPEWAWAGEGDRVIALGRWIFDCGHPDPSPRGTCAGSSLSCSFDSDCGGAACLGAGGTCSGSTQRCFSSGDCPGGASCRGVEVSYRSELHPPQAVAVVREGRGGVLGGGEPVPVTRADVYVSPDGGGAGDACVLTHRASLQDLVGASCFPLAQPVALLPAGEPALATDFTFDVPLPAGGAGDAVWQVEPRGAVPAVGGTAVPAAVEVNPVLGGADPHLAVTVRMSQPVGGVLPTGFAATILAGWTAPPATDLAHVRVTIDSVTVRDPAKPAQPDPLLGAPPGWSMQVSVNGEWQRLAGLGAIGEASSGQSVPVSAVFEQHLPRAGALRLFAQGASASCVDTLMGQPLGDQLVRFGFDLVKAATCLDDAPRDLGVVEVSLSVPGAGAPPARMGSRGGAVQTCSATATRTCTADGDCPAGETCEGAFALQVRAELLSP